jgi:hypothetical protein
MYDKSRAIQIKIRINPPAWRLSPAEQRGYP